jgi:hypothetical protein
MRRRSSQLVRFALSALLLSALAQPARADSFLTSVSTGSKTATRVAPAPYTGTVYSPRQVKGVANRALSVIKNTKNLAIGLDVIQRVDSMAMDNPKVGTKFRLGLAKLARSGDPKFSMLRGVNLVQRRPDSRRGITYVRKAAKALPKNSAAQLLAGLSVAQRDGFGSQFGQWEKRTPLKREAAKYINKAEALEKATHHPRPLVREGIKQAKEYAGYYEGFNGLLKK